MITFKLNSTGDCANKIIDGVPTGEWHHILYSEEYLKWLAEGNLPIPAESTEGSSNPAPEPADGDSNGI